MENITQRHLMAVPTAKPKSDEHETNLIWDYTDQVVRIYTTRQGVLRRIKKRLNSDIDKVSITETSSGVFINIPMSLCRDPSTVVKVSKSVESDNSHDIIIGAFILDDLNDEGTD